MLKKAQFDSINKKSARAIEAIILEAHRQEKGAKTLTLTTEATSISDGTKEVGLSYRIVATVQLSYIGDEEDPV